MLKYLWLLSAIILAGCHTYSPRYTFRSVGTQSNDPADYKKAYVGSPIYAKISFRGYKKLGDTRPRKLVMRFDMKITNQSDKPITLRPSRYALLDDESQRFSPDLSYERGSDKKISLHPDSSIKLTLYFPLPAGYSLRDVGSFRLTWNYQIGSKTHRRLTKFIKREVEYYYHSPYYYDPYHDHYHYRPFRYRFGLRYHHRFRCY